MMVGSAGAVVSDDTRLVGMAANALITSPLLPPMSTTPTMCEPGNSVSVSAAAESLIAVPPVPVTVPELVMTVPTLVAPFACMPVTPEIVPALTMVMASAEKIPTLVAPVARMIPELPFSTFPVLAEIALPLAPVASIIPEVLLTVPLPEMPDELAEINPEFVMENVLATMARPPEPVGSTVPEFTAVRSVALIAFPFVPFARMTPAAALLTFTVLALMPTPLALIASIVPVLALTFMDDAVIPVASAEMKPAFAMMAVSA